MAKSKIFSLEAVVYFGIILAFLLAVGFVLGLAFEDYEINPSRIERSADSPSGTVG